MEQSASNLLQDTKEGDLNGDGDGEGVGLQDRPPVIFAREDSMQQRFAASELPPPPLDTRPKVLLQFAYTTSPRSVPRFFDPSEAARRAPASSSAGMGRMTQGSKGGIAAATGVSASAIAAAAAREQRIRGYSVTSLPPPPQEVSMLRKAASIEGSGSAADAERIATAATASAAAAAAAAASG